MQRRAYKNCYQKGNKKQDAGKIKRKTGMSFYMAFFHNVWCVKQSVLGVIAFWNTDGKTTNILHVLLLFISKLGSTYEMYYLCPRNFKKK